MEADVLDLNISIKDGKYIFNVYDTRDKFKFSVVRLKPRFSNQSDNIGYCKFVSQIIRFSRICNNLVDGTKITILYLFKLLIVSLGFSSTKLLKTFRYCILRHKFNQKFIGLGNIFDDI